MACLSASISSRARCLRVSNTVVVSTGPGVPQDESIGHVEPQKRVHNSYDIHIFNIQYIHIDILASSVGPRMAFRILEDFGENFFFSFQK
jgi:hypothetical protein